MKVLAFCDHLSAASSGGAERVAVEVYRRLAAEPDIDLTVVSVLRPGHEPADTPGVQVLARTGRDLSGLVGAEMLLARGLGRWAREVHQQIRPDVLHANGLHFHSSAVAARLARRSGTPLATTAHLGDLSALDLRLRLGGTAWDATIGAYAVRSSRAVVAVSRAVAAHMQTLGARPENIVVAPNGLDHDIYHARGRQPVGGGGPLRAVFVGRLIGNKGPSVALDAVGRARAAGRDVRLSVLGDGPLRTRLEEQTTALGISDAVEFCGHVSDVAAHLRRGDVLLRPSFTEGLPLAVLEAMACGLPVICSTVPGNTEVVCHDRNGWHTAPGSAAQVSDALVGLCDDRDRLRRLAEAAITVAGQHSWDNSAAVHATALRGIQRRAVPTTSAQEPVAA